MKRIRKKISNFLLTLNIMKRTVKYDKDTACLVAIFTSVARR